jgi:hypothetical protein
VTERDRRLLVVAVVGVAVAAEWDAAVAGGKADVCGGVARQVWAIRKKNYREFWRRLRRPGREHSIL